MAIIRKISGNTLESFSDGIGKDVIVEKVIQNGNVMWQAGINNTKVSKRDGVYFEKVHVGIGEDEKEAIKNFTVLISGKELVYQPGKVGMERFKVPILDY